MAKHTCPDCGAAHEMDTAGRIARLEERVEELEARQPCTGPHFYWPTYQWPTTYPWTLTGGTYQPNAGPITVYSTSDTPLLT